MANPESGEGTSATEVSDESSESTLQLNIKTLDSQFCSFNVDKNIVVSAFKEKIASQIGVPVEQQRLIFRGKVLNDEQHLSEYNLENGDTLHLVERQPQPSPGEATSNNGLNSNNIGDPRNLIGQIAHSVILGTLNIGESGETVIPDFGRAVGAILNSIGNIAGGMQPGFQPLLGNEMEGPHLNAGNQFGWFPTQIPREAAIGLPSLNMPIPESLSTLTEFMNRMELVFSRNDAQENQPTTVLPTNSVGYPTLEALTIVLQHAQHLVRDHAVPALSHTASRLDQEGGSNDPAVRGEVQTESMQFGVAMQHLGALFLELGRTVLTLRMGQSSAECFVNSGPAVYISPSGPNPIMVQPFPLQTSSLFGDAAPIPVAVNPASLGNVPRNVNIHIHTGAAPEPSVPTVGNRAPTGEEMQGEIAASRQHRSENNQTSAHATMMDDEKARSRPTSSSGESPQSRPNSSKHAESLKKPARSDQGSDNPDGSSAPPLGLGIGGLQPKKRNRLPRSRSKKSDGASSSNDHGEKTRASGQHVVQSIASLPVQRETNPPSTDRAMTRIRSVPPARQNNRESNIDVSDAMSQVLQSPSLDGLLAGVSQQTGVGSPDMLRSMLQQFTENPEMRNTVNHLAEQIDSHDLGSMFSGLDSRGQGGGIDLSRMMQQMMPIVSQTLGGLSSMPEANPSETSLRREMEPDDDPQVDVGSSDEIFRSLVERASYAVGDGHDEQSLVNALCSEMGLAQEFMAMLRHDVSKRLEDGMMF